MFKCLPLFPLFYLQRLQLDSQFLLPNSNKFRVLPDTIPKPQSPPSHQNPKSGHPSLFSFLASMEFRFRAGEERCPSFLPPNTCSFSSSSSAPVYFAEQAWRAGFAGIGRDVVQPMTAVDSLQRLIQKERIREEIMREMTQRRILEEEVRREMEIERLMVMRRVNPERFCDLMVGRFMPEVKVGDEMERGAMARVLAVEFDERFLSDDPPRISREKKFPMSPQKLDHRYPSK